MISDMSKLVIFGPRKYLKETVDVLYESGKMQVEEPAEAGVEKAVLKKLDLPEWNDEASQLYTKINSICANFPHCEPSKPAKYSGTEELLGQARKIDEEYESEVRGLVVKKNELEMEKQSMLKYEKIIRKIQAAETKLKIAKGFSTIPLIINKMHALEIEEIQKSLADSTRGQASITVVSSDEDAVTAIVVFNQKYFDQVYELLRERKVIEVNLPRELSRQTFGEALKNMEERSSAIGEELKLLEERMKKRSEKSEWPQVAAGVRNALKEELEKAKIYPKIGATQYTFLVNGWVPSSEAKKLEKRLAEKLGGKVSVREVESEEENAPVQYDNPFYAKPFEYLLGIFSLPKYGAIDPSIYMAFFLPMIFGMIVGDIGYGLVILALALYVHFKVRIEGQQWLNVFAPIFILCSLSTIFWGFMFGEFFGEEGAKMLGLHAFLFARGDLKEGMIPLLIFAVSFGVLHVLFGSAIGFKHSIEHKHTGHAIERGGTILAVLAAVGCAVTYGGYVPGMLMLPFMLLVGLGLVMMFVGGGIAGALEIFGVVGNIVSYARIMAIGLSSVILAMMANKLGGMTGNIFLAIIVAGLIHTLNIVICMFSPFIHALRLQYVEFFNRFYEGGGKDYSPFGKKTR